MSCLNYPSNYRVVMESNNGPIKTTTTTNNNNISNSKNNQPKVPLQTLSPIQCSCQRGIKQQQLQCQHKEQLYLGEQQKQQQQQTQYKEPRQLQQLQQHQQNQHKKHLQLFEQQKQQQQQQHQHQQFQLFEQQQPHLQQQLQPANHLDVCLVNQPSEQTSTNSKSSPPDSQNSQLSSTPSTGAFIKHHTYTRTTSESGGQLSCDWPFEIVISSAHPPARPTYERRLPSGMAPMCVPGNKSSASDEEFYSLSSASSDREDGGVNTNRAKDKMTTNGKKSSSTTTKKRNFMDCESEVKNQPPQRNTAILHLLREVVQLINQSDDGNDCGCAVTATTKIRNIGALGEEADCAADNGPFGSGIKRKSTPNRNGCTSPCGPCGSIDHTEMFESQQLQQLQQQTLAQPVNIPLQLPCNLIITPTYPPTMPTTPAKLQITAIPDKATTTTALALTGLTGSATPKELSPAKEISYNCVGDLELIEEIATLAMIAETQKNNNNEQCSPLCPEECICNQPCNCPVHGVFLPSNVCDISSANGGDCSQQTINEEEEECDCIGEENTAIITEPCQSESRPSCITNETQAKNMNVSVNSECSCCHCQAMREQKNCMTLATKNGSSDSCTELKFFIDSIIMDLDAMEKARRKKQAQQNTTPTRASVCPRQSFPVTITEVSELGASSLYIKWVIHDCYGIAGYEIYVDGYLTNRYFNCNHEAAVVCDVDVTRPHKIVLVAQPKQSDCSCGDNTENVGKELMRKSDAGKMEKTNVAPSALWMPSVYLYDPCEKSDGPAVNRGVDF